MIPVEGLLLDVENPRHERVQTEGHATDAVIEDLGAKLVRLATDIAEKGLSPIDRMVVIKNRGTQTNTVVEGNGRITAVKLLRKPELRFLVTGCSSTHCTALQEQVTHHTTSALQLPELLPS